MHFLKLPHIFLFPFSFEAITEVGMNTPPPYDSSHSSEEKKVYTENVSTSFSSLPRNDLPPAPGYFSNQDKCP